MPSVKVIYRDMESTVHFSLTDTVNSLRRKVGESVGLHWSRVELRGAVGKGGSKYTGERSTLQSV